MAVLRVFITAVTVLLTGQAAAAPATREECRASKQRSEIVDCIRAQLYDPCDDAGGSWGRAQCAWAHLEIADERVRKAEAEIRSRLQGSAAGKKSLPAFEQAAGKWREYRDIHCKFSNATVDLEVFETTTDQHGGFCLRRLTEQRAQELGAVLSE